MQRKSTDFAGWQSEIQYLDDEIEREKRHEAAIALQRREAKVPLKRKRLWRFGLLCFLGAILIAWYGLFPLLAKLDDWIGW